ncbi:MAG: transcription-repair coupling factor, partial [Candidatus Competibacterales bacterium]
ANPPGGIEYYLPLFFEVTETLFDYLPEAALVVRLPGVASALASFQDQVMERFEQRRLDPDRPLLPPSQLYLDAAATEAMLQRLPGVSIALDGEGGEVRFASRPPPALPIHDNRHGEALVDFLATLEGPALFVAESAGRREVLLETLKALGVSPSLVNSWAEFRAQGDHALVVAPVEDGLLLEEPQALAVIGEPQLYGERARSTRRRASDARRDAEGVIRNLHDLAVGAPVVHQDLGVGRYQGLKTLEAAGIATEFVVLQYADEGVLYVPVSSLHLISRYTGANPEQAPLHRLGSEQWARAKARAAEKVNDAAAELLDLYARRESRPGRVFDLTAEYAAFAKAFPFEETPDQATAIEAVLADMAADKPMDRVVCGDVGFGKTEVAMRAAFVAVQNGLQVAVLVPTTLLAQQHYQNFADRFADWPVQVASISRFRAKKELEAVAAGLTEGRVDICIGTHKLLQKDVQFKRLGLVIIDEEHRFGVRQKERLKELRTEVDILTLTATPIPRTLNMAMAGIRDLSIIATPPPSRLAVKTFVSEWNNSLIQEAILRELKRGGQVYFLHNEVQSIERIARQVGELVPQARLAIAHGQMPERELEQVMLDFYHQRCQVLVCSTIIESGIDVPNANTIIIHRADKLGLAQLHQLRGRVGRSHHRAYAYLITPSKKAMTADAVKRIEAIESLEELGAGFMLANHDLEIRGAGELLGEEQSGQIFEVGFTLYMELLERAVAALKRGEVPELDRPLDHGPEIDLQVPALIPEDYLPDIHTRLIMYKRIASAATPEELKELQVEMIDRFGLLPPQVNHLFRVTSLKLKALPVGIAKIEAGAKGGRFLFNPKPNINAERLIQLIQKQPKIYKLDGQDKLRFSKAMDEPEARVREVECLIETLAL